MGAIRLALLLLFNALAAGGEHVPEPEGFWTGPINSAVPATIAGGEVIDAPSLARLVASNRAIIVDVSNAPMKPDHLAPGALWLPPPEPGIPGSDWIAGAGAGVIDPDVEQLFREYLARSTAGDLDHPIVLYCHERCWLSWNAAKRAIRYGYRRIYWFPPGIEGWRAAGFRTVPIEPQTSG